MRPMEQIQIFLTWFYHQGVDAFDVHVKVPLTQFEDYKNGQWVWLTHHEGVCFDYIKSILLKWIKQKNANGSDIYFRPHKNGNHKVIFLDDVPTGKAKSVLKKYGACVTETHPGNTQIWLKVDRTLNKDQRKQAQIILKDLGVTDPGSVSGDHLGRLCGVKSQKHKCWVNLIGTSDLKPWCPKLNQTPISLPPVRGACASQREFDRPNHHFDSSDSGREWGWVLGMLRSGMDQRVVTEKLIEAANGRGKKNSVKYACYTVQKAVSYITSTRD